MRRVFFAILLLTTASPVYAQSANDPAPIVRLQRGPVLIGYPGWDRQSKAAAPDNEHNRAAFIIPVWDMQSQQQVGSVRLWCNRRTSRLGVIQFDMNPELIGLLHRFYLPFDPTGTAFSLEISAHDRIADFGSRNGMVAINPIEMRRVDSGVAGTVADNFGLILDSMLGRDGVKPFQISIVQSGQWPARTYRVVRLIFAFESTSDVHPVVEVNVQRGFNRIKGEQLFANCLAMNRMD